MATPSVCTQDDASSRASQDTKTEPKPSSRSSPSSSGVITPTTPSPRLRVVDLYDPKRFGSTVSILGRVASRRRGQFVDLTDETNAIFQLVFPLEEVKRIEAITKLYPSTAISVTCVIVASQGTRLIEGLVVTGSTTIVGRVRTPALYYPALPKVSDDTWRDAPHQRVLHPKYKAIFAIRSALSQLTHRFMASHRVQHADPNTITGADCEAAGEMFIVTTFGERGLESVPIENKISHPLVACAPTVTSRSPNDLPSTHEPRASTTDSTVPTPHHVAVDSGGGRLSIVVSPPTSATTDIVSTATSASIDDVATRSESLSTAIPYTDSLPREYGALRDGPPPVRRSNHVLVYRGDGSTFLDLGPSALVDVKSSTTVATVASEGDTGGSGGSSTTPIDWSRDFFHNSEPARLTVSSQLGLEALATGLGDVYTTNPSYRAEKSNTTRHLASFTHVEAELSAISFAELMGFEEAYVRACFQTVLTDCASELAILERYHPGVTAKLESFLKLPFASISYTDAIDKLKREEKLVRAKFPSVVIPRWGDDLKSECERYLAEDVFCRPVFVYNMPAPLKSFYMRRNADADSTKPTVQGCDLLIPGMGELIGGSMREGSYEAMVRVMIDRGMFRCGGSATTRSTLWKHPLSSVDHTRIRTQLAALPLSDESLSRLERFLRTSNIDFGSLSWYLDLRKNAYIPTGGFGLGFDRLVLVCTTSLDGGNIRDVVPFPVSYGKCAF